MLEARDAFLARIDSAVAKPAASLADAHTGIVHLGLGAFHQSHQAPVIDACLRAGDMRWAVAGVSLRSPSVRAALAPQGGAYTLLEKGSLGETARIVGAHKSLLCGPAERPAIVAALASPHTRIVSLTVTEAGYLMTPSGDFDEAHPALLAERAGEGLTIHGLLLEALAARRAQNLSPPTLLSCDNLSDNGTRLRHLLLQAAEATAPDLHAWLRETLACPSTMVDRITPATTDDDRSAVATIIGTEDRWPVVTEPFWQWVIEDEFPLGRPDWEPFGVTMARDVAPFETMKLRLLNGAHSAIAYAGVLCGFETVADAFADPDIAALVDRLWETSAPTLPDATRSLAGEYTVALAGRFANPALRHRCAQIAGDGSQKLPHRIVAPARDLMARGAPLGPLPAVIALWAEALRLPGNPFAEPLGALREAAAGPPTTVAATLLSALGADPALGESVAPLIQRLRESGPRPLIGSAGKAIL